jgi:hypothetical protein
MELLVSNIRPIWNYLHSRLLQMSHLAIVWIIIITAGVMVGLLVAAIEVENEMKKK